MTIAAPCVHWWVLPTPDGPYAEARCKKCGATKALRNSMDDGGFGLEGSRHGSYGNRGRYAE